MKTYDAPAGSRIDLVCEDLARLARRDGVAYRMMFNDREIVAEPGVSAGALCDAYFLAGAERQRDRERAERRRQEEVRREAEMNRRIANAARAYWRARLGDGSRLDAKTALYAVLAEDARR